MKENQAFSPFIHHLRQVKTFLYLKENVQKVKEAKNKTNKKSNKYKQNFITKHGSLKMLVKNTANIILYGEKLNAFLLRSGIRSAIIISSQHCA